MNNFSFLYPSLILFLLLSCQTNVKKGNTEEPEKIDFQTQKTINLSPIENSELHEQLLNPSFREYYYYTKPKDTPEYRFLQRKVLFQYIDFEFFGLEDNNISALLVDDDDIWVGTWQGGLARYSLPLQKASIFSAGEKTLDLKNVISIDLYQNEIWITSYDKIQIYNKQKNNIRSLNLSQKNKNTFLTPPLFTTNQILWGTSKNGVLSYQNNVWQSYKKSTLAQSDIMHFLHYDNDYGILWGGYRQGLKNNKLTSFAQEIGSNNINIITSDQDSIFVGTNNNGLWIWDKNKNESTHFYQENTYLSLNQISTLFVAQDYLFVGTNQAGVYIFDRKKEKWFPLGLKEGLIALDITSISMQDSKLIIAALGQGITIIDWKFYVQTL